MVVKESIMVKLGEEAPNFYLPDFNGKFWSFEHFPDAKGYLVIFMCNHCPFVKYVQKKLVEIVKEFQRKGIAVFGINSNDYENYPEDSPEMMKKVAEDLGYTFPYLIDETQEIARKYQAQCTPQFFLYDKEKKLFYRGQMDSSRPTNGIEPTGEDLIRAVDDLLEGKEPPKDQRPSTGCSIKWKEKF